MKDISDLDTLETFGFCGKALNSLAAVANPSVTTAKREDDVGMVYNFDSAGNVIAKRPIATSTGTLCYGNWLVCQSSCTRTVLQECQTKQKD